MPAQRSFGCEARRQRHDVAKAQRQKTGSREEHERERDLRDHEAMAQALGRATRGGAARLDVQRVRLLMAHAVPTDERPERDADDEGDGEANDRDAPVEHNLGAEREVLGAEHGQETRACGANPQSQQAADHGEKRRFDDELYQHAIAAGADRLPDGELFRPGADPDHQEVGKIHDANRQQHDGAGLHEEQRAAGSRRRDVRAGASRSIESRRRPSPSPWDWCAPSPRCAHRPAPARPAARRPASGGQSCASSCPSAGDRDRDPQGWSRAGSRGAPSRTGIDSRREGRQPPCAGIRSRESNARARRGRR